MGLKQHTRDKIEECVESYADFRIGNISAKHTKKGETGHSLGRLPWEFRTVFLRDRDESDMYVIWDYWTPIAWKRDDSDIWKMPPVTYSVTTTHHQNVIATILLRLRKK